MKKINIIGKHNQDKLNKVVNPKRGVIISSSIDFSGITMDHRSQIEYANKIFLDQSFNIKPFIEREITNKIYGYKRQDIEKKILNNEKLINYESTIEKIVESKLKCFYCKCEMALLYENVRQKNQWTLDRIDNDMGHNYDNVVIACLECNVRRKRLNSERFEFSKKCMHIKKVL